MMVDESKVVPLIEPPYKPDPPSPPMPSNPLLDQLKKKSESGLRKEGGSVFAIPKELEPHMTDDHNYIILADLKNVGVISTR